MKIFTIIYMVFMAIEIELLSIGKKNKKEFRFCIFAMFHKKKKEIEKFKNLYLI